MARSIPELTADEIARFWRNTEIGEPDECWNTKYAVHGEGSTKYAQMKIRGKKYEASRIAYAVQNGPVGADDDVLHTCNGRRAGFICQNGRHLYLGDAAQNAADKVAAGRSRSLPARGSRLTVAQQQEIFDRVMAGETTVALAEEFGITRNIISHAKAGRRWMRIDRRPPHERDGAVG